MTKAIPVVILAGGRATRMGGGDKCLLPLGGRVILDHVLDRAVGRTVVLNANGDPTRFDRFGVPVVSDSITEFPGPLAGILAGMDWAADQGATHVVSVPGDTPFFPRSLFQRFDARAEDGLIHLAGSTEPDGRNVRQPTFGLWPTDLRDDLRSALAEGVRKVVIWAERHKFQVEEFGDSAAFFNINRPEDLAEAELRLRARA